MANKKKNISPPQKKSKISKPKPKNKKIKVTKTKIKKNNKTSLYIIVIMTLLVAILVLLNKFSEQGNKAINKEEKISSEKTKKNKGEFLPEFKKKEKEVVQFEEKQTKIKIYFLKLNEKTEEISLFPANRKIHSTNYILETLQELIKGPNKNETDQGLLTALPNNIKIHSIEIKNKTAIINFNKKLGENATGNILLQRINQIIYTATQFENIDNIKIKINGRYQKTLGSDGLSISGPLHRP